MSMRSCSFIFLGTMLFLGCFNSAGVAQTPIVPKKWLHPDQLEQVESLLQKQLDTGVDMGGTAWDMAAVKDAELVMVYVSLYESLPADQRTKLLKDQEAWLDRRQKAADKVYNENEGTIRRTLAAGEFQSWTEKRIAELKKRLPKRVAAAQ